MEQQKINSVMTQHTTVCIKTESAKDMKTEKDEDMFGEA